MPKRISERERVIAFAMNPATTSDELSIALDVIKGALASRLPKKERAKREKKDKPLVDAAKDTQTNLE